MQRVGTVVVSAVFCFLGLSWMAQCEAQNATAEGTLLEQAVSRGLDYLRDKGQNDDGLISPRVRTWYLSCRERSSQMARG